VPSRPRWQYGRQHFFRAITTVPETVRREQPAKHWRQHMLAQRWLLSPLRHESRPDTPEDKKVVKVASKGSTPDELGSKAPLAE
ncbi:hypothetical protein LEMLEM_LOCUS13160, partial [Lemmus lemmus]